MIIKKAIESVHEFHGLNGLTRINNGIFNHGGHMPELEHSVSCVV